MYRLHTTDLSPFGQRARMALDAKGLLLNVDVVDTFGGTDALATLAPMAQIPILEMEGSTPLPESQSIVDFLDSAHPAPRLLDEDAQLATRARLLTRIADLYLAPHFLTLIVGMRPPSRPEDMTAAFIAQARGLSFVETYLGRGGLYAVGETLSMADLALAPFLFYVPRLAEWHKQPDIFTDCPMTEAYLATIAQDQVIARAFGLMEKAFAARIKMLQTA